MHVYEIISAISDVFADTTNLQKRYGIVLKRRDVVSGLIEADLI